VNALALVAIVALAAILRCWGLDQGLPFVMSRPDEVEMLQKTAGFPAGDLNPRWFVYPNLFFWLSWLWLEGVLAVRRLVADTPPYSEMLATQLASLIAYGRVLSAAVGTAAVALVYAVGRRLGGSALGLLAALLLATNYLHVRDSHGLKADVYLTFVVPAALWLLAAWARTGAVAPALQAGLAAGLATGLKYPGVLLVASGLHANVLVRRRAGTTRWFVPSRTFWLFAAVTTVTFLCVSPFLLLEPTRLESTFSTSVRLVYGPGRAGFTPPDGAPWTTHVASWIANRTFVYHVALSLRWGCGLLVALLLPFACLRAWRDPEPFWPLSVGFLLVYYAVISLSQVTLARYFTPLTPLIALLVSHWLVTTVGAGWTARRRALVWTALAAALVAEPFARAVAHDRVAAETDTRVLATRWMDMHLPPDAAVAVLGSLYFPIADPDVPAPRRRVALPLGATDLDGPGVTHVVVHEHLLPFSRPLPAQMAALRPRLEPLAAFTPFTGAPAGWFEELDAYYLPFHDFAGVVRPGPQITIYALRPEGTP
jgi:4-amino-4-deoxy-L-arabinose transferase-like glycosyltransferase